MIDFFRRKKPEQIAPIVPPSPPVKKGRVWRFIPNSPQDQAANRARVLFKPYAPPTGVRGAPSLASDGTPVPVTANDDAFMSGMAPFMVQSWGVLSSFLANGLNFKGYPTLAAMMLRAEFRKPVETLAKSTVREWIKFNNNSNQEDTPLKKEVIGKIAQLEAEIKRLDARNVLLQQQKDALSYGIGHIWIDREGDALDTPAQKLPLIIAPETIKKGSVRAIRNIDPIWTNPNAYNADNPLRADFYKPTTWWVQGIEVHSSRLLTVVPFALPDILKPAFNFGGLSLTQMLEAYVHNFLRTRQSVSDLVSNFATKIVKTDMSGIAQDGISGTFGEAESASVISRIAFMNQVQSNNGTLVLDKDEEDMVIASVPLGGLDALQAQSMEFMAGIPGIPLVKLFGIQPAGLNASSDGEIRVFYDEVSEYQEANMRAPIDTIVKLAMINIWGEIDESITWEFVPLWQLSEKELAEVEKIKIDIDALAIQEGIITPDEARRRQEADPHSVYSSVNLSGDAPGLPDGGDLFSPNEAAPTPKSLMSGDE